jgi:hypothetical protein
MRRTFALAVLFALVSIPARQVQSQVTVEQAAGYAALLSTPAGALAPMLVSPGTKGENAFSGFSVRFSNFSPKGGGDGTNSLGATWAFKAGSNAAIGATAGYLMPGCTDCDGQFMAGADLNSTLWNSTGGGSINLQAALGWGNDSQNDVTSISGAVGFPFAYSRVAADKSRLSAFLSPGYGWGRMSGGGESMSSGFPTVGVGGGWEAAGGWGLHASFQKVFVSDISGNTMGLGFSYRM